jgi:hypothetical protein
MCIASHECKNEGKFKTFGSCDLEGIEVANIDETIVVHYNFGIQNSNATK